MTVSAFPRTIALNVKAAQELRDGWPVFAED
jgi:hypothetical protein